MTQRKYQDKDGAEKVSHEIRMQDMKMLSSREGGQGGGSNAGQPAQRPAATPQASGQARPDRPPVQRSGFDDMDDDIPF